jgi:hypothetical protein
VKDLHEGEEALAAADGPADEATDAPANEAADAPAKEASDAPSDDAPDVAATEVPPPPLTSGDGTTELAAADDAGPAPGERDSARLDEDLDPAASPGHRRRQVRHRIRTAPVRTIAVALVAVAVAVALPVLGIVAARTIANSREGRAVVADAPVRQLPSTPAALLVGLDDAAAPASLTLFSLAAGGKGGTVLVLPLATAAYLDGPARPQRLDAAYERGGLDGQTEGVESVLGISTAVSEEVDEDALTELLEPFSPVDVTLDAPVVDTDRNGVAEELFGAGDVRLSARDAARLLLARAEGESELARLPRAAALWGAILDQAATRAAEEGDAAATASSVDLAGFLADVTAGAGGVEVLRTTPSFDPADPSAPELLQADVAYLRLLVATVMPSAVSPSNGNISFRVVNSLGDPMMSYKAVGRLAAVQANIVLVTETTDPPPERTTVVWHSPAGEVQAGPFAPVLGAGAPSASGERIDGIDATVVLGREFPGFVAAEEAKIASTSTTSTTPTVTTTPEATTTSDRTSTTRRGDG